MTNAEKLLTLKALLGADGELESDLVYQFYLDTAEKVICDIRNSETVELKYEQTQIKIAIELFNKRGVEGQTDHGENGIDRKYENSGISESLLNEITPFVKTPFSAVRVIT